MDERANERAIERNFKAFVSHMEASLEHGSKAFDLYDEMNTTTGNLLADTSMFVGLGPIVEGRDNKVFSAQLLFGCRGMFPIPNDLPVGELRSYIEMVQKRFEH